MRRARSSSATAIRTLAVLPAIILVTAPVLAQGPIQQGVSCLVANQSLAGTWGDANGSALRDTCTAVDTLTLLGQGDAAPATGIALLNAVSAPNYDYLSRQVATLAQAGSDTTTLVGALMEGENPEVSVPAAPNYPDGGWGVALGFGTDTLTTALVLDALNAARHPTGLAVVQAVVQAGTPNAYQFDFPADGTNLSILIRNVTGTVRLFIQTPASGTFFLDLTDVSTPTVLNGLPQQAGTYGLSVQSQSGSPNTYSFEVRFMTSDFDVGRVSLALSDLGFAQNLDGSWGIRQGEDGLFMVTAEVLRTLEGYGDGFAPLSAINAGLDWLQTHQNPDGGFGSDPGVSSVYETALAVLALAGGGRQTQPAVDAARQYLLAQQGAGGCWDNDAYATALAVSALFFSNPCLLDVDGDGVADAATDLVYIARRLLNLPEIVPPGFRVADPSIPPDAVIAARIDSLGSALDVDQDGRVDVATDIVYIGRSLLNVSPAVPSSFRMLNATIPPDATIVAQKRDALCR